jgi:hypothetical protein
MELQFRVTSSCRNSCAHRRSTLFATYQTPTASTGRGISRQRGASAGAGRWSPGSHIPGTTIKRARTLASPSARIRLIVPSSAQHCRATHRADRHEAGVVIEWRYFARRDSKGTDAISHETPALTRATRCHRRCLRPRAPYPSHSQTSRSARRFAPQYTGLCGLCRRRRLVRQDRKSKKSTLLRRVTVFEDLAFFTWRIGTAHTENELVAMRRVSKNVLPASGP